MQNISISLLFNATLINNTLYYVICAVLALLVMFGIFLMSKVEKARLGNAISAFAILFGVIITLVRNDILNIWVLYLCLAIGAVIGLFLSYNIFISFNSTFCNQSDSK